MDQHGEIGSKFNEKLKNSNTGDTMNQVLVLAQCTYSCCISTCTIVNSPVNHTTYQILMHFCDLQGKFTIVQVDIQQLYVYCTKESTRVSVSPVF